MFRHIDMYFGKLFCNFVMWPTFAQYVLFNVCCMFFFYLNFIVTIIIVSIIVCVFCWFVFFVVNRSGSPPGGNQVDGLPPALRLRTNARHDIGSFWSHIVGFLETCTFVWASNIFYNSNTFRWCHRSMKWSKWIAGEGVMVDQRFFMKHRFWTFHEKLTLVDRLDMKFNEFSSLPRISLVCGAALLII